MKKKSTNLKLPKVKKINREAMIPALGKFSPGVTSDGTGPWGKWTKTS